MIISWGKEFQNSLKYYDRVSSVDAKIIKGNMNEFFVGL